MLRRLVLTANLDGHTEMLVRLRAFVQDRKPERVLFAGGILACDPGSLAAKLQTWELFFASMGKLGVFTAVMPGVADAPLRHFLRLAKNVEWTIHRYTSPTRRCWRKATSRSTVSGETSAKTSGSGTSNRRKRR